MNGRRIVEAMRRPFVGLYDKESGEQDLTMAASLINKAFMKLSKRAEMNDPKKLVATFVDVGPLFDRLSIRDHQVLYGRRGTGKTHALTYVAENARSQGHAAVFLDMRNVGSSSGLYTDPSLSLNQRATRLLVDTLLAVHEGLFQFFVDNSEKYDLSNTGPLLDQFADAATTVVVVGSTQQECSTSEASDAAYTVTTGVKVSEKGLEASLGDSVTDKTQRQNTRKIIESGVAEHRVNFGSVRQALGKLVASISGKRTLILLDEWSSVPLELQPYLADLIRRSILSISQVTVKIAAIEQRSRFSLYSGLGDYIGVELGADISADVNLDDFMVFDNDADRAKAFFQELLFQHFRETEELDITDGPKTSAELIQKAFTQASTFDEFVRATEGVPRDAINIVSGAAQRAMEYSIGINDVTISARNWYTRDKEDAVRSNSEANALLHWIIDRVIRERRTRAFLLRAGTEDELTDSLFDARVLHVVKRNVSSNDRPGERYSVYKLDYGCYVDLRGTAKSPEGLLIAEDEDGKEVYVEVPPDDYRSIRRAILNLDDFKSRQTLLDIN